MTEEASTFQNEEKLPKLPLPSLESTLENLIQLLKPLVSHKEYLRLLDESINFLNNKNLKAVQLHLLKSHKINKCYLEGEGITANSPGIYGELRGSTLPRNPFFILENDPLTKSAPPTQSFRAAVLVTSSLRFIASLRKETITPDFTPSSKTPLTMSNYRDLFGTTRIPVEGPEGRIGIGCKKKADSTNLVILCKGQFYSLEVLNKDDQLWFTKHELSAIFDDIINDSLSLSRREINKIAIGAITTESKLLWRESRQRLEETNPELMKLIDEAVFVLCLDQTSPVTDDEKVGCISHGTSRLDQENFQVGSCLNRWYDKLQIVVTKNAVAGVIWESTSADATTVLRFFTDIYTDSVLRVARKINGLNYTMFSFIQTVDIVGEDKPGFQKLIFKLPGDVNNALHLAETRLADLIGQHEYRSMRIPGFGKDFILERLKLHSDSLIQLVFQIAHYALYGKLCSSNEPVSTRRFQNARTELINIQSDLVLTCCQSFITSASYETRWKNLRLACVEHSQRVSKASRGFGFERHLSALITAYTQHELLNKLNPELPAIDSSPIPLILDPQIEHIYKTEILIANCGNPALNLFGFTPAVSYGYGVGYIIKNNSLEIVACSQWRQTERFLNTVNSVINEIKTCWRSQTSPNGSEVLNGSRARELESTNNGNQSIIQSLPMELIKSNNSSYTNNKSHAKSTEKDKSNILGGYDYFDVNSLIIRSNEVTRANSGINSTFSSPNVSSTNLRDLLLLESDSRIGSPLNPNNVQSQSMRSNVGRKIDLNDDDL